MEDLPASPGPWRRRNLTPLEAGRRYHGYHVSGVVVVYCYLLVAQSTASSAGSSRAGGRSPYNLTISAVEARAATVHWDLPPVVLPPSGQTNATYGTSSAALDGLLLPPVTGFEMTIRPTFPLSEVPRGPGGSGGPGGGSGPVGGSGGPQQGPGGPLPTVAPPGGVPTAPPPRVVTLEAHRRSFSFQDLTPRTEYQVYIVAYSSEGPGNVTETITFTTLNESAAVPQGLAIRPTEAVLVVLILVAWFCAIALFLHKWGKIRIIQPREPRYKHSPKNLETIKVVKKPTDSVIHKHYTRQLSRTMLARENKRIERMNTMPNIKVNTESLPLPNDRLEKRFQTMPEIEMENLSGESQT